MKKKKKKKKNENQSFQPGRIKSAIEASQPMYFL
jgi:hypothetical protein